MYDPYSVLGISRGASADEVKKAYRKMSRMYHPDANVNNPNKAQAEEKFKQVQEAYEQIMYEREHGAGTYGNQQGGFGNQQGGYSYRSRANNYAGDSSQISQVISLINSGRHYEAMMILNSMANRDARWFYLHAHANYGLGNVIDAMQDARQAVALEPNNPEYQDLVSQLEQRSAWYSNAGGNFRRSTVPMPCCVSCLAMQCLSGLCGGSFCC